MALHNRELHARNDDDAGQVSCHLQNCYYHASDFPPSMPVYDLVVFASADSNVLQLRSFTTRAAAVKRSRTPFGGRAFSVAGPDIWNSLPATIRTIDSGTQPSVVPSRHICSAQHLTISFYINIDIVFCNQQSFDFNLYDWAL